MRKSSFKKIVIFLPIVVALMAFTLPSAIFGNAQITSNANGIVNNSITSQSNSYTINDTAQVEYQVGIGHGSVVSLYNIYSVITYSKSNGDNINIRSYIANSVVTQMVNASLSLNDFKSFKNSPSYQNSINAKYPLSSNSLYINTTSSASNSLVTSAIMNSFYPGENYISTLSIKLKEQSGFGNMFEILNHSSTMAYLFIPQLLPPNLLEGHVNNNPSNPTSPDIIPIPPGGGTGGVTFNGAAQLNEYDIPIFPDLHLFNVQASLSANFVSTGGNLNSYSGSSSVTPYLEWSVVSQSVIYSTTSSSVMYTKSAELTAYFPYDGYSYWWSSVEVQLTVNNADQVHIFIHNQVVAAYTSNLIGYTDWSDKTLYDNTVSSGSSISVTQYITEQ